MPLPAGTAPKLTLTGSSATVAFTAASRFSRPVPTLLASVNVTMTAAKGAAGGHKQAVLRVSAGGQVVAQAMLYTLVK